jgi:plasmid maintenance system antidote protein VapI
MEQLALKPSELADILGGRNRVSEILYKKRQLTIEMTRSLRKRLAMPPNRYLHEPTDEILNEEFVKPLGLTANAPAKAIGCGPSESGRFSRIKEVSL